MIVRFVFVCCLLLPGFSSLGASVKLGSLTVGSLTYSNVTVLGANTTDLYFKHDHGIANVKLKYLSAELQKKFDYDPKAAAEAEKRQNEDDALYQSALATRAAAEAAKAAQPGRKAVLTSEDSLADPISDRSLLGKPGPPLDLDTWLSDKPAVEGKFVLVSFWAPWSIPCRKWIPELNALQKKFKAKLVVVGVCSESEAEIAEMNGPKLEFCAGIDSRGVLSTIAGVTSIPCVLLLDTKGVVRYAGHPGALTEKKLEAIFARAAE